MGVFLYSVTQGAQFVGLAFLPSVTVSLLFNFTNVVVALLGIAFLAERPSSGMVKLQSRVYIVMAVINVLLSVLLTKRFQEVGAAVSCNWPPENSLGYLPANSP